MIAVTFALPTESSAFVRSLTDRKRKDFATLGKIGPHEVAVVHTGVGAQKCAERLTEFLCAFKPSTLIGSGFCGGTTDELRPGDLVIATNASSADLANRASEILPSAISGAIFSVDRVIDPAVDRYSIGREKHAIAIDMETETIAHLCANFAVPMLALRVVSDSPAAPFPAPPEVLFDIERQRTKFSRLISHIARKPATVAGLATFSRQITMAKNKLAGALRVLLLEL